MHKYFTHFKISLSNELEYRADVFIRIAAHFIPILGFYYLWRSLYLQGAVYGSYDFRGLATYFLVSSLINSWIPTYMVIDSMGEAIRTGVISANLIKPLDFRFLKLSEFFSQRLVRLIVSFFLILASFFIFKSHLAFPSTLLTWATFLVSASLSIILAFWLFFNFSIASFWLNRVGGFAFSLEVVSRFLNGSYIPLDLLPTQLQFFINLLPFKYIVFFPIQIFLSQVSGWQVFTGLVIQSGWILACYLLSRHAWRWGIYRYEAVGS